MKISARLRLSAAQISFSQSLSSSSPIRRREESMLASAQSIRCTNCSLLISKEKKATDFFSRIAIFCAIFSTNAVLPILGRAAIKIKSEACRPEVRRSKSMKPVAMPVMPPFLLYNSSIRSTALITTSLIGAKSRLIFLSETPRIMRSALSSSVLTSSEPS